MGGLPTTPHVSLWTRGSGTGAQTLRPMGVNALRHAGSSRTRDRTMCPASASRFLSTEPPRKFLKWIFLREDKASWVTGSEAHSPPYSFQLVAGPGLALIPVLLHSLPTTREVRGSPRRQGRTLRKLEDWPESK